METQHTPGDWKTRKNAELGVGSEKPYLEVYANPTDGTRTHINVICKIYDAHYRDPYSHTPDNQSANAKLIASAPNLLKTLQEAREMIFKEYLDRGRFINPKDEESAIKGALDTVEFIDNAIKEAIS